MVSMIDGFSTSMVLLVHAIWLFPVGIAVYRTIRRPTDRRLRVWMIARGLDPNGPERDHIESYLYRSRWFRSIGFAVGWSFPIAALWITRSAYETRLDPYTPMIVGYAVGVVLGEIFAPRRNNGVASVERRNLSQYVRYVGIFSPKWLGILPSALAISGQLRPTGHLGSYVPYWIFAVSAPIVGVLAEVLMRWIVSRPQRADSAHMIRTDDALRSNAAQAIMGCAYAGLSLIWISTVGQMSRAEPALLGGVAAPVIGLVTLSLSVLMPWILLSFVKDRARWIVPRARESVS